MPSYKIKSAKLLSDDHLTLSYTLKEDDKTDATVDGLKHNRPAHADLKKAFSDLAPHLAVLTGCIKAKQTANAELVEEFHVTGVLFKEDKYFRISGTRKTDMGNVTLVTPKVFYDSEDNSYQLMDDCESKLQEVKKEILAYIVDGKRAPEAQQSLFPEDQDSGAKVTHMQIAEPNEEEKRFAVNLPPADKEAMERVSEEVEKPKPRGSRKRVAQSPENPSGVVE